MARYLVQDFFRERPAAAGAAGATVQFYDQDDNPIGSSTTSDADGKFNLLDEVYPGLGYYTATKGGITKRHEAASIGFIGTLSAADLVTLFDGSFSNGILTGIGSGFALSAGGGMNISVAPGGGVIDGHPFRYSVAKVIALAAADGSNPRIDRMVASLVPPGAAVGNPGAITIKKVDGTPAASPAAPALVATADEVQINLGTWTVAAGAGAPSAITSEAARSIPGIHTHVMADITDLAAALALLAPKANPTFTGTVVLPAVTVGGTITANSVAITPTELGYVGTLTSDAQTQLNAKAPSANPVFTGTVTVPDGALAIADTSGLQAALDAKAPAANPTFTGTVAAAGIAATGNVTSSGGLHHTGGTWGFNGESVSGKQADPPNISTGTIDATWGTTEADILEDIRTSLNSLLQTLRNVGILSA